MAVNKTGYLLWLADVVRAGGLNVIEVDGWKTRGHGNFTDCRGVVCHHTAGAPTGNYPSLAAVRDGVPGLAGPLSQLGLARDGTVYVIAAGVSWHAGTGVWKDWLPRDMGNWYSIGIEAESVGTSDDWTAQQRAVYPKLCAVLCKALGVDGSRVVAHKEYSDAGKIDPAFYDMGQFRATVNSILSTGNTSGDNDMDMNTPVAFSPAVRDYFNNMGGPGFGDLMAANFPQGGSAPYGTVTSWDSMSSRAAFFKAVAVEKKIDTLTALVQQLLAK